MAKADPAFYEEGEEAVSLEIANLLNIPNGSSMIFNHWRPGSCIYLCISIDEEEEIATYLPDNCDHSVICCLQEIIVSSDQNGLLTTDYESQDWEDCNPLGPPANNCDDTSPCFIQCR